MFTRGAWGDTVITNGTPAATKEPEMTATATRTAAAEFAGILADERTARHYAKPTDASNALEARAAGIMYAVGLAIPGSGYTLTEALELLATNSPEFAEGFLVTARTLTA